MGQRQGQPSTPNFKRRALNSPPAPSVRRIFISTGEVSGDLQGSFLIEALQRQASQLGLSLDIVALGGDRMAAAGAQLLGNTIAMGAIGALESLRYVLPTVGVQRRARAYLAAHPPDLVVLIDYVGSNLPLGSYIRRQFPVPIVYYIAPQAWVWSPNPRVPQRVIALSDVLLAIFPEEAQYFAAQGAQVTWVGHPLVDDLQTAPSRMAARAALGIPARQQAIALIPASRYQEIKAILPVMLVAAQQIQAQIPQAHFWIPLALEAFRAPIARAVQTAGVSATLTTDPRLTLAAADLAIAKSGTVNLEAALLEVPQVVTYRLSALSAWLYQWVIQFDPPFISPVNLVTMEPIVPELIQQQATPDAIATEALRLLQDPVHRQQMLDGYTRMRQALGEPGVVDRAAEAILKLL